MAYVEHKEIYEGRSSATDEKGVRTYTRCWRVRFNDKGDGPAMARLAVGVYKGQAYSSGNEADPYALCVSTNSSCVDANVYLVTANYTTDWQQGNTYENPTDMPAVWEDDGESYQKIVEKDIVTGKAIANKASDSFLIPQMADDSRSLWRVTQNIPAASYSALFTTLMRDKVNASTWRGCAAKTVKVKSIRAAQRTAMVGESRIIYYERVIEFAHAKAGETWKAERLNEGYRYLDGAGARRDIIIDGNPVSTPVMLNNDGGILAVGADPIFLTFDIYYTANFSLFGLD